MELRQIEYFLAIIDNGGTVAAARRLDITQPTLSQAIKALERELGTPLFYRVARGLTPTSAGRALIGPGRRLLRNALSWPQLMSTPTDELHGRLDLAVFPSLVDAVVDLIAEFCNRHPQVEVHQVDLRSDQPWSTDAVRTGRVDAAIMHLPTPDDTLALLPLGEQEYVAVYPPGTELPPGPVDLTALPDVPMILVPESHALTRDVARTMRSRDRRPRVAVLAEHRESLIPLVTGGLGGAIVDRQMAESAAGLVTTKTIEPRVARRYGLIYGKTRRTPVADAFLTVAENAPGAGHLSAQA